MNNLIHQMYNFSFIVAILLFFTQSIFSQNLTHQEIQANIQRNYSEMPFEYCEYVEDSLLNILKEDKNDLNAYFELALLYADMGETDKALAMTTNIYKRRNCDDCKIIAKTIRQNIYNSEILGKYDLYLDEVSIILDEQGRAIIEDKFQIINPDTLEISSLSFYLTNNVESIDTVFIKEIESIYYVEERWHDRSNVKIHLKNPINTYKSEVTVVYKLNNIAPFWGEDSLLKKERYYQYYTTFKWQHPDKETIFKLKIPQNYSLITLENDYDLIESGFYLWANPESTSYNELLNITTKSLGIGIKYAPDLTALINFFHSGMIPIAILFVSMLFYFNLPTLKKQYIILSLIILLLLSISLYYYNFWTELFRLLVNNIKLFKNITHITYDDIYMYKNAFSALFLTFPVLLLIIEYTKYKLYYRTQQRQNEYILSIPLNEFYFFINYLELVSILILVFNAYDISVYSTNVLTIFFLLWMMIPAFITLKRILKIQNLSLLFFIITNIIWLFIGFLLDHIGIGAMNVFLMIMFPFIVFMYVFAKVGDLYFLIQNSKISEETKKRILNNAFLSIFLDFSLFVADHQSAIKVISMLSLFFLSIYFVITSGIKTFILIVTAILLYFLAKNTIVPLHKKITMEKPENKTLLIFGEIISGILMAIIAALILRQLELN